MDSHPDDKAVDEFAAAMKAKLREKREQGRGGWDDPGQCEPRTLARMLLDHLHKGDPVDVANFAMMLWHRNGGNDLAFLAIHYIPMGAVWTQHPSTMAEVISRARAVLSRIREIYRPEYVRWAAASQPDSLLGCCRLLGRALDEAEGRRG